MKLYVPVGFIEDVETRPSVFVPKETVKNYYGEELTRSYRYQAGQKVNDDISLDVRISIIADQYVLEHIGYIRYVVLHNTKWKVNSVEPGYPRIILNIGDIYNGDSQRS